MTTMNINGLTLKNWLAAAGYEKADKELRKAWKDGEDPTEHRAESEWAAFVDATGSVHVCGEHLATSREWTIVGEEMSRADVLALANRR